MLVVDHGDPSIVLVEEMGERRRLPYAVKGPMAVGHHDDREATRPEHTVDLEDRGDGIGEVLENVGHDYGVEARVGERPETTGVESTSTSASGPWGTPTNSGQVLSRPPSTDLSA